MHDVYQDHDASQWDEFDALTRRLDAPFFYCTGNHDVTGDIPRAIYTKRHGVAGRTYYSLKWSPTPNSPPSPAPAAT